MSSSTKTVNSGTKYHNQTDTLVNEQPSNEAHVLPHSQLIQSGESSLANQAIDVSMPPGATDSRFIRKLMTPSGLKPVIILTDEEIELDVQHDYVPGVCLPEQGHVWSDRFESTSVGGDPVISESVALSMRTGYYMLPFKYFNSHILIRLICKPAFSQAQSFWVSRSFNKLNFSTSRHISEIGFSWFPSKANEIFVLMPWSNPNYIASTESELSDSFGFINVKNISELVTSTGNDTPLSISYYFAPYKMYTYVPQPITTEPPPISSGAITLASTGATYPASTITLGNIEVLEPTYICGREFGTNSDAKSHDLTLQIDSTTVGRLYYFTEASTNLSGYGASTPVLFQPGTYPVTLIFNFSARLGTNLGINWFNIGNQPPVFTAALKGILQIDSSPQTKEIPRDEYIDSVNFENLPPFIEINSSITNPISKIANGFNILPKPFKTTFKTCVISQDPDIIKYTLLSNDDKIIFITYAKSKNLAKLNGYKAILKHYESQITQGQEQIFEYQYNPNSTKAQKTYGQMFDHSPREDHHLMFLQQIVVSSTNKYQLFNFTLNLSTVAATYPYINTREYLRHYLKSHMPLIVIKSNKNPFSNLLCRLVQGTYSNYEDVMQLPGPEWDPSCSELKVAPYWDFETPAVTQITIPFTLAILSGQIDEAGMQLLVFFNTSTLRYHHKIDYNPAQPAAPTELASVLNELGMCSKCAIAPCQCSRIDKLIFDRRLPFMRIAGTGESSLTPIPEEEPSNGRESLIFTPPEPKVTDGILQGIESETITEQVENQSLETRSPTKLDGVTMETSRIHSSLETGKTQIEKDYHFVGAISTPLTLNLRFIAIPISHNAFGKMEVTSAKKYRFWQGEPTFKVTLTASSVLPGIVYLAQVPPDFDLSTLKAESALRMYSSTQEVFWNSSVELPIKWYNPIQQAIVDYSISPSPAQLGYIVLAFPTPTGSTFGSGDQNIKITVHCNTSNISYSRPSVSYPTFDYPGLQFTVYTT